MTQEQPPERISMGEWKSRVSSEVPAETDLFGRRQFMKTSGGATIAAVTAWHGLQVVSEAKVPAGGSGY